MVWSLLSAEAFFPRRRLANAAISEPKPSKIIGATVTVCTMSAVVNSVQRPSEQVIDPARSELGGIGGLTGAETGKVGNNDPVVGDVGETGTLGATALTLPGLELGDLPTKLALMELATTELVESDESTLSTELVAVKGPVEMKGVVPAIDMVGVVERPWALLRAVLTELVTIAGVTLESDVEG